MSDPVVATDGHSYERRRLAAWLARRRTSPLTGAPIDYVVPNHALRAAIEDEKLAARAASIRSPIRS